MVIFEHRANPREKHDITGHFFPSSVVSGCARKGYVIRLPKICLFSQEIWTNVINLSENSSNVTTTLYI